MDTESLKAFLSVARHASFSAAAKELFLTQPAVSKRIAALEAHLNHSLFDRLGKEVVLTEAGELLLPRATEIISAIYQTERMIRERDGEIIGTLRVATSHHIGLHRLPPVLRKFAAIHKQVNLQFEFLDSEKAHDRVLDGECELAVVTLAPNIPEGLVGTGLWTDPLLFVASDDHPLLGLPDAELRDLSQFPAILPDLNTFTGQLVKRCFDKHGLNIMLSMSTNYLETIKMMVSVGLGWSVLPKTLIDQNVRIIDIRNASLSRSLGIITHKKRSLGNAAQAFLDILLETTSE